MAQLAKCPSSSVVRASDRIILWCHGFDSSNGLRFFVCPEACDAKNITFSHLFTKLKIYHLSLFIVDHQNFCFLYFKLLNSFKKLKLSCLLASQNP